MLKKVILMTALAIPQAALAYDCDSDCGKVASFRYPCPTFGNPGRKCTGREPVQYAACETQKAVSCELWKRAADYAADKIKPMLEDRFNARSWAHAEATGTQNDYMASCVAAGVAACSILGSELGGPWGGALSGAIGTFVSFRVCEQSRTW